MELFAQYIAALTNLYGLVSLEKVAEIYNQQNDEPVDQVDVEHYLDEDLTEQHVYAYDEYFVHETIVESEDFDSLLAKKGDKPYYIPPKGKLLRYADMSYFEKSKQYHDLLKYVKKNFFPGDAEKAERLCQNIRLICFEGLDIQKVFDHLESARVEPRDDSQVNEIMQLVMKLSNSIRTWENNGYTRGEMSALLNAPGAGSMAHDRPSHRKVDGRHTMIGRVLPVLSMILWASLGDLLWVAVAALILFVNGWIKETTTNILLAPYKKALRRDLAKLRSKGASYGEMQALIGKQRPMTQVSGNLTLIPNWLPYASAVAKLASIVLFVAAVYRRFLA